VTLISSSLIICHKNLTSIPPQQQTIKTEERGESGVDQSGVQKTGCLFRRGEVRDCANHATNPFYSEHSFDATTHERHNNLTLVQLVVRGSLGDEEGRRVVEWPSICNFILLIHLEIERV
jgi:hypothetical protein